MMLEEPDALIEGAWLISKVIGVSRCLIGIEDNKMDAVDFLRGRIAELKPETWDPPVEFRIEATRTRYPQGSEKQLIQSLTGRNVPARKLPMDVGVVVQNVATAIACQRAIRFRAPLLDRVVTVSGSGIKEPKNIRAPLGTSLDEIVQACGGMSEGVVKILAGGPMMGRTIPSLDMPLIKATNGLLLLRAAETYLGSFQACIQCAKCLEVCPLGLEPNRISVLVEAGRPLETETYGTSECFECGCCSYACPSHRPLVQFIQVAKSAYRKSAQILATKVSHG
jgi:electron transport complex protein RnfC